MIPRMAVIIPALNEEKNIRDVIRDVRKATASEVVVIDDASSDATAEIARSEGARVLPLVFGLGAWGAMRAGIRYANQSQCEIGITMDADGQHLPGSIDELIAPILSDQADVVIGSCVSRGSASRKLSWQFFKKLTRLDVHDLTSGFRAYNAASMSALISADTALLDYQDIGVLLALNKAGFRIMEVPVSMCRRTNGHSRIFSTWWDVMRYLVITFVLCLSKMEMKITFRKPPVRG